MAVALLVLPLGAVLAARQQANAAADAAALAGADASAGLVPGDPCRRAADIAAANGAEVSSCARFGLLVRIEARVPVLGITVTAVAVAGPAGGTSAAATP